MLYCSFLFAFFVLFAFAEAGPGDLSSSKQCEAALATLKTDPKFLKCSLSDVVEHIDIGDLATAPTIMNKILPRLCSSKPCDQSHVESVWNKVVDACLTDESRRHEYTVIGHMYAPLVEAACFSDDSGEYILVNAAKDLAAAPESVVCNKSFKHIAQGIFQYAKKNQLDPNTVEPFSKAARYLSEHCIEESPNSASQVNRIFAGFVILLFSATSTIW